MSFTPPPRRRSLLAVWGPLVLVLLFVGFLWWSGPAAPSPSATGTPAASATRSGASPTQSPSAQSRSTPTTGPTRARSTPAPTRTRPAPQPARTPDSGLPTIAESALPPQARTTLSRIQAGGPYPYRQDGQTFSNRERLLPKRPNGYYREYTVTTPGEGDRGPRRIVGGLDGDLYWTSDHYGSFRQILEGT